jgi:hypothetical protein
MDYLTCADLHLARECPTKLYYKKHGYQTDRAIDHQEQGLASGSLILEKIAQILYPNGIPCPHSTPHLKAGTTWFNAQFLSAGKLARIDILVVQDDRLEIIDIKNKTFDSKENRELELYRQSNIFRSKRTGEVNGEWRSSIEEVAWQKWILQELYPQWHIDCFLLMPDRYKTCAIANLLGQFRITDRGQVEFLGNPEELQAQHFLALVNINPEVAEVLPSLQASAVEYLRQLELGFPKVISPLGKHCRDCEFSQGYRECWGELALVQPHIFDLYQMGRLNGSGQPLVNELISQGKVSMYDIPPAELTDSAYNQRQLIQMEYTKKNQEWISPRLGKLLRSYSYPLHFIDFETARTLIPAVAGLRPNEQITFQWSCHTFVDATSAPIHQDWIEVENPFPNLEFAQSLIQHLRQFGEHKGTVFTWGSHETSVLKDLHRQMALYGYDHLPLHRSLAKFISKTKFVDLDSVTRSHYFHPLMKNRTSLKVVVAAIWHSYPYLHQVPHFRPYLVDNPPAGEILSPYSALPKQIIADRPTGISDGNSAMLAYWEIVCGRSKDNPQLIAKWLKLLRQYCCLDTMAMIMIWHHWYTQTEV